MASLGQRHSAEVTEVGSQSTGAQGTAEGDQEPAASQRDRRWCAAAVPRPDLPPSFLAVLFRPKMLSLGAGAIPKARGTIVLLEPRSCHSLSPKGLVFCMKKLKIIPGLVLADCPVVL